MVYIAGIRGGGDNVPATDAPLCLLRLDPLQTIQRLAAAYNVHINTFKIRLFYYICKNYIIILMKNVACVLLSLFAPI